MKAEVDAIVAAIVLTGIHNRRSYLLVQYILRRTADTGHSVWIRSSYAKELA